VSLIRLGEVGQPSQTSEDDGGRRQCALLSSIITARQSAKLVGLKARLPTLLAQEGACGYRIALRGSVPACWHSRSALIADRFALSDCLGASRRLRTL